MTKSLTQNRGSRKNLMTCINEHTIGMSRRSSNIETLSGADYCLTFETGSGEIHLPDSRFESGSGKSLISPKILKVFHAKRSSS